MTISHKGRGKHQAGHEKIFDIHPTEIRVDFKCPLGSFYDAIKKTMQEKNNMDAYNEAHLFVAAIRLLHHQKKSPPSVEDVCKVLNFSTELGHSISRNLNRLKIIDIFEDPFSTKLAVTNHLAIENISRHKTEENSLAQELEKFQAEKMTKDKKFEAIQAEIDEKKKKKFADIEATFKKEIHKYKSEDGK